MAFGQTSGNHPAILKIITNSTCCQARLLTLALRANFTCDLKSILPKALLVTHRKRTKSYVFALSNTVVRSLSNKIFRVNAVTLLRVPVQRRIGASHCRFNVSTAFRGAYLLCFAFKPTCFDHNVLVTTVCHIASQRNRSIDTPILRGYQLFRNYVRPHEGLDGKTPAEACGIKIDGENKWLTLIQNASKH
jgi:hypothetical protein